MSQTFEKTFDVLLLAIAILFVSTLFPSSSSAFASLTEACAAAIPVEIDSTYRGHALAGTEVVVLSIPAAGVVALEVTVPAAARAEPKLGFLGRDCSTAADPGAATIENSFARQTIAFRAPGEYYFRIAAQDPRRVLGSYKLHARFAAAETVDESFATELGTELGRLPVHQTDFYFGGVTEPALSLFTVYSTKPHGLEDDEVDPDPNGLAAAGSGSSRGPQGLEDDEVDPDPNGLAAAGSGSSRGPQGLEDDEVDPDPNGLAAAGSPSPRGPQGLEDDEVDPDPNGLAAGQKIFDNLVVVHGRDLLDLDLCRRYEADDHQDVSACATPLSLATAVAGRLGNDWNDDVDVFSISIAAPRTLQITTRGNSDTVGGLYGQLGQRLAVDDDSGEGANFRIVKSLPAGRYFLRVEGGGGSAASYDLTAEALEW